MNKYKEFDFNKKKCSLYELIEKYGVGNMALLKLNIIPEGFVFNKEHSCWYAPIGKQGSGKTKVLKPI